MAETVTGLILAGGEGRRVGGADKGLLDYRGRPLVAHVIERLAPQVGPLLISANRNLDDYLAFGFPVVTDASAEHLGPLAGIEAGLRACETAWLVVCPCDCPQLPVDLVASLMSGVGRAPLAIAVTPAGLHPTFMLCRRALLPSLETALASGERKLRVWCSARGAAEIAFADEAAFRNINTPEELTGTDALPPSPSRN